MDFFDRKITKLSNLMVMEKQTTNVITYTCTENLIHVAVKIVIFLPQKDTKLLMAKHCGRNIE